METSEFKRSVMGLLCLPPERREEAVSSLLDLLKCKHESDGLVYTSMPPQYKCKKCGQFYR